jgi:ketosteroid isomerase-like protein
MSQENVEVVRRVVELADEGLRRGDLAAAFDEGIAQGLIASNVEWQGGVRGGTGVAGLGDVVGKEGVVQFVRRWTEDFDDFVTEYEQFIDASDDRVLVLTHQSGTGKESRAPVEMPTAMLFEVEAGCVVRVVIFLNREDALEAAGLRE